MPSVILWVEAFSGLGLFLFGMLFLEGQIRQSAGHAFKSIVQRATGTPFRSLLTGLGATAVFQSSSVVTLMALSLVGAHLLTLGSAIAVIFGANIGTTITVWIVALVGFKIDINLVSYLMIGIGGIGGVLVSSEGRWKNHFGVMVGFGLLFLGLEGMKRSFGGFADTVDLSLFASVSPYWFAAIGMLLTAIIQASAASIAIAQSAVFAHIIGFEAAAAFVIGANAGTTVTAMLGAIGGTPDKKRVALAHFIFNISAGALALGLLQPLTWLVSMVAATLNDVVKIALFHTLFNLMGVVIWYPFIGLLERMLKRTFKKEPLQVTKWIHNVPVTVPDVAIDALKNEVNALSQRVEEFALFAIDISPPKAYEAGLSVDKLLEAPVKHFDIAFDRLYTNIRLHEGEVYRYIILLSPHCPQPEQQLQLQTLQRTIAYLATAAKSIKDMLYDIERLYDAESSEEQSFYKDLRYQILKSVLTYHAVTQGAEAEREVLDETYKRVANSYKNSMNVIESIAKNPAIPSEMTTITINALHLAKSFTKSLRNALPHGPLLNQS
ncbi:Na/Pi symporter [Sulfurimonas sp. HSL1-2]|uniref:Na/Pi cotransporter family protein n=1 Tax=Thiomicrolovo zhangzhouensis TaxID=3131933 RepID=UPI0031F7D86B